MRHDDDAVLLHSTVIVLVEDSTAARTSCPLVFHLDLLDACPAVDHEPALVTSANPQPVTIVVEDVHRDSGLLQVPSDARACYVLAHGAGAEMRRSLGLAVFAGMLGVTIFGIFLTPVFFNVVQRLTGKRPAAGLPPL